MPELSLPSHGSSHALCILVEPLLAGRRVVIVGDASAGIGARASALGARLVHVYDPNAPRVERALREAAAPGVTLRPLPPEFEVRDGAFDVALVPDVTAIEGASALFSRLRRLVSENGVVVAAAPNPDRFGATARGRVVDYYALYDLVALQFAHVKMVGLLPFGGVALAELGLEGEAPSVRVDTQLVAEPGTPAWFVAVGGARPVELDPYLVVELPRFEAPVGAGESSAVEAGLRAQVEQARAERDGLRSQLGELAVQRDTLTAELGAARGEARSVSAERDEVAERQGHELARVREDAAQLRIESQRLRQELDRVREAATRAQRGLDEERASHTRLASALQERVDAQQTEWQARFGEVRDEALRAAAHATELRAELARASEAHAAEIAQYEGRMRERAQAIKALELELLRRERIVQELVAAVDEARERGDEEGAAVAWAHEAERARAEVDALRDGLAREARALAVADEARGAAVKEAGELRERLEHLALELARREADVQTTAWRVAEWEQRARMLEDELRGRGQGSSPAPPEPVGAPEPPVGAPEMIRLSEEIDVLRKALAQEHEARAAAESGDALRAAREALARQSVLLEQLSQQLASARGAGAGP
jgi:hypothetical protein